MVSPPPETGNNDAPPIVTFRSNKKRKANYRQRAEEDEQTEASLPGADTTEKPQNEATQSPETAPPAAQTLDELIASAASPTPDEPSIAEAIRLRNQRRSRLNGVGFKASQTSAKDEDDEKSLVPHTSRDDADAMPSRFAPQMGTSTQLVNKHMMEYIESKLSTRTAPSPASDPSPSPRPQPAPEPAARPAAAAAAAAAPAGPGTLQGKLMEIDLGDEARARNVALTDLARRRLLDAESSTTSPPPDPEPAQKKPRLGRDGKPWRGRKRRNSEDIARDKLVEQILHESRLDVYDTPPPAPEPTTDGTADDRLAEEFRRDFLDAMAQRRQQQAAAAAQRKRAAATGQGASSSSSSGPPRPGAANDDEVLRGPKLGGSRSQRAAMRDILLAKEREKERAQRRR